MHWQVPLEPLVASLARPLTNRLEHAVDILVFNPPYVPTYDEEMDAAQHDAGISGSWAGGTDGMQVTDALLRQADVGVIYFFLFGVPCHPHSSHVIYVGTAVTSRTILPGRSEAE